MKINFYFILLLSLTFFTACKKDDIAYENAFQKSNKTWLAFKKESNNNYSYTVSSGSWTGYSSLTVITIKNGKVVARAFKSQTTNYKPSGVEVIERESWTENANSLNTHQSGAGTLTLDEVYAKAKSIWLVKRKEAETFFETNNNGMISSAGYVEKGCQDDCFNGIKITLITKD